MRKHDIQYQCLDEHCRTVVVGNGKLMDGIRCPRCDSPVVSQPFKPRERINNLSQTVLMSSDNHNGWKLEELLFQVKLEVSEKVNKIINDPSPQAQLVVRNNLAIIEHLGAAEALQRASYIVLNAMKPNEGPTGTPRIGK